MAAPPSYDDSFKNKNPDAPPIGSTGPNPPYPSYPPQNVGYPPQNAAYPNAPYQPYQQPGAAPYQPVGGAPYQSYPTADPGYNSSYGGYPQPGGMDNSDDPESGGFTSSGFGDKNVRRLFIRKVFITLGLQLLVTFGVVSLFTFHEGVKSFIQQNSWTYYIAYVFFLGLYITLVCCESVRRKHPQNIILLAIFTLAFSYMTGTIASFYNTQSVVIALGTTVAVCFTVILFSMQTKYDFTKCSGVLFVCSMVFFFFGLITIFTFRYNWYIQVVYGCLGALLFTLFLAFDVQLVMGGKKYELEPEEHILGAILLYIDIVYIFIFLLSIFGRSD